MFSFGQAADIFPWRRSRQDTSRSNDHLVAAWMAVDGCVAAQCADLHRFTDIYSIFTAYLQLTSTATTECVADRVQVAGAQHLNVRGTTQSENHHKNTKNHHRIQTYSKIISNLTEIC